VAHFFETKTHVSYTLTNGKIIDQGGVLNNKIGLNAKMDYNVYTTKGNGAVLSTARLQNIPLNSTINVKIGLTYQIPAEARDAIRTNHIIKIK